jgi:4-amino-4-deoxy-L-arabinose transferase-like glycosyltransferase
MLNRSDRWHTIFAISPALVLSAALLEAVSRRVRPSAARLVVVAALMFVVIRPVKLEFLPRRHLLTTGMVGSLEAYASRQPGFFDPVESLAAQRRPMFEYIEKHTTADERVMFASSQHEQTMINETDLYFLADRLPGTRHTQYEPNMTSRHEVQAEIVASLERYAVRVVVLSSLFGSYPEDQPVTMLKGSTLLDEYLRNRFVPVARFGVYTILERRP